MNRKEYQEMLNFKENRIKMWEEYGCILSRDEMKCEFVYSEVKL